MKSYIWFTFKFVLNVDSDNIVKVLISNYRKMPFVFTPQEKRKLTQLGVPILKYGIDDKDKFDLWCRMMTRRMLPSLKNSVLMKLKRGKL